MSTTLKLYRDGRIFDLTSDPFEEGAAASRRAPDLSDIQKLLAVLDQYANARPAHLLKSAPGKAKKARDGKQSRKQRKAARQRGN